MMQSNDRIFPRGAWVVPLVLGLLLAGPLIAGEPSGFDGLVESYESVRLALVNDTLDGTTEPRQALAAAIDALARDFSAAAAGVDAAHEAKVEELLGELAVAAEALTGASDLGTARDAFYALSKPLVRWRAAVVASGRAEDELPVVVYCSMAKRSWLQPAGTIGNPYHGKAMAECGEIVGAAR